MVNLTIGAGIFGLALAIEEVAKYSNAAALMLLLTRLPTGPVLIAGSDEQQRQFVTPVAVARSKPDVRASVVRAFPHHRARSPALGSAGRTLTDLGAEALVPQSRPALIRLTVETLARRHIFLLSVILVLLRFLLKLFAAPLNVLAGALDCIAAGKPGEDDVRGSEH